MAKPILLLLLASVTAGSALELVGSGLETAERAGSASETAGSAANPCPVWFVYNKSRNTCECGKSLSGLVDCDPNSSISLLYCYCMTYNEELHQPVVGACTARCTQRETSNCHSFNSIGTNTTMELNNKTCGDLNRTGQLCGSCKANHSPEVYSYFLRCVACDEDDFSQNLLKYMAVAFLPLTAFYIFVITLKISITSGSMVAYILTCQIVTTPILIRILAPGNFNSTSTLLLINCFSVWNLDFLRSVHSPFCLHPKMNTMHILALDYLVGIYPLFLIFLTYLAILVHDHCQTVARVCRFVSQHFGQVQSIRGSLIHTFASFLVLSYVKILNVSFDLLFPVTLYTVDGKKIDHQYLYNEAEIVYFGKEHLPFAILAVLMLMVFNCLPLALLVLYPCQCFQRSLNLCGLHSPTLFTFMDAFQGCYRHNPRDCRYFAALYLFVRILQLLTFAFVRDFIFIPLMGFYFLALTAALTFIEPYTDNAHNKIDKVFFLWFSSAYFLTALSFYLRPSEPQIPTQQIYTISMGLLAVLPITYGGVMIVGRIIPSKLLLKVKSILQQLSFGRSHQCPHTGVQEGERTPLLH